NHEVLRCMARVFAVLKRFEGAHLVTFGFSSHQTDTSLRFSQIMTVQYTEQNKN
ncbi:mCG1032356, partial [Mus musculus]